MFSVLNQTPISTIFVLSGNYTIVKIVLCGDPFVVWKIRNNFKNFFEPIVNIIGKSHSWFPSYIVNWLHGLQTPGEEIAFTARPKINSQFPNFRYDRSILCLPHRPKFSDFFDLCLHWMSVVRDWVNLTYHHQIENPIFMPHWVRKRANIFQHFYSSISLELQGSHVGLLLMHWQTDHKRKCPIGSYTQGVLALKFPISILTQCMKNYVPISYFATRQLNLRKPQ